MPWLKIREIEADGSRPNELRYKLNYDGPSFTISLSNRGRPVNVASHPLQKAYDKLLPLKHSKFEDLEQLCRKNAIPPQHASFFRSLPHEDKPAKSRKAAEEKQPEPVYTASTLSGDATGKDKVNEAKGKKTRKNEQAADRGRRPAKRKMKGETAPQKTATIKKKRGNQQESSGEEEYADDPDYVMH